MKDEFKPTKIFYTPAPGEPNFTTAYGKTFKAGEAVTIEDEAHFNKLKGNPQFTEDGKARKAVGPDKGAEALDKEVERLAKEAREAEAEADESNAGKDAKARALAQAQSIQTAKTEAKS